MNKYILITLISLSACSQPQQQDEEMAVMPAESHPLELTEIQMKNIDLEIDSVQLRPLRNLIKLNGYLGVPPHSEALITSLVEAQVTDIKTRPFHDVKKGEILLTLRGQSILDLQQMYFEHKSELKFTEKDFNRKQQLKEGGHISDQDFEMAERNYNQLKASLTGFENKLKLLGINPDQISAENMNSYIAIRSSLNGSVEEIFTRINEYVHPGDPLVRVVSLEDMHVELEVFERDLPFISMGQQVEFWLLDQPEDHYLATIEHISKEVDPGRRTVTTHAHLKREIPGLRPGNYVEARVILSSELSYSLPDRAFINDQGLTYIFRVNGNDGEHTQFKKLLVTPEVSDGGYTSFKFIEDQSMKGEFVIEGAYFLMAQSRIDEGRGGEH